ncbi:metallophosphoesterase family protein [Schauerella aestuarii]|uniref:alkaline phosphatase family protein n=1 Tax=Schauerella aestuarii TaxID=2511204 RepID=UPI002E2AF9AE|nr:alkaline phosphatase family protein [Achromobacter aestuarii]
MKSIELDDRMLRILPVGTHAFLHFIDVTLDDPLPVDTEIDYDLRLHATAGNDTTGIADWAPHLVHGWASCPTFVLRARADNILFGSCRKPHHCADDGMARADALVQACIGQPTSRPSMLMLCGDQVYADDVAGPMLAAVHALIARLGLYGETLEGATVADSTELYAHPATYYRRESLLPAFRANEALRERFFGGVKKPIFTTSSAHNHLVTLAEVLAMYLLVWSPTPWALIGEVPMPAIDAEHRDAYRAEARDLTGFRATLPQAARAMAHLPTLMIFDDHDVTDDWNLSARWEEEAYGHPFSRRIVGNALLAYALCQGWGNNADAFVGLRAKARALTSDVDSENRMNGAHQDALIGDLLAFSKWGYVLPTQPKVIVLDTRTQRWRSTRLPSQPSGLMDWESLCELQQALLDEPSAVIVSAAPMFGVKLIETVQRVFTWAGQSLMVDAENWMAHRGAANVMMNIFRHSRTPGNYVVLSGDVHYSFMYDIRIRHRDRGPDVWQITSSGIKNEFPSQLLNWLDRANRWLYARHSPLNWLTKRRHLEIRNRLPDRRQAGERLWNGSGIGQVLLDAQGRPRDVMQHDARGSGTTRFMPQDAETSARVADVSDTARG